MTESTENYKTAHN